jgi:predicted outer membrane protein
MSQNLLRAALFGVAIFPACAQTFAADPLDKVDQAAGAIVEDARNFSLGVLSAEQNDKRIVHWLSVDNRGLAECAKFAAEHSSNEAVKNFARQVADEHGRFQDEVFAKRMDQPAADVKRDAGATAALINDEGRVRDGKLLFRPTDFVAVKEKICKAMGDKAKKEMEALSGAEFDHAFTAHMVFGHEALAVSIDALDNDATDGLKDDLHKLHDMVDKHAAQARELQKQVRAHDTAARPTSSEVK